MRAYGPRRVLALAACLMAAASGCTSAVQPLPTKAAAAVTGTPTPSPEEPALTKAEAGRVFREITLSDDLLRTRSDVPGRLRSAVELVRDGQAAIVAAAYQSTGDRPPRHTWGTPMLLVPRFAPGQTALWFTALVTRDGRPTLLTFAKGGAWQLSSAAELLPGQEPPQVKLDGDGYATALAPDDKTVTISPQFMGPVHAAVAETGSSGVAAGLIASGPYTTEVATQIAALRDSAKKDGFSYDSIFSPENYPVYALRTESGGALIQYSLSRTTTTTAKTAEDDYIPVPETARWAIRSPVLRRTLRLVETHQYATAVPPLSSPSPAAVIAHDGALTRASGQ
ncbi:hypothetical protein AB0L05_09835 [Nonomuraea pusilla]|uniref:hypothetical protein n=1 Tax=Nonomuraea pusilla TaxID=46177 RepID=UPI00331F1CD9